MNDLHQLSEGSGTGWRLSRRFRLIGFGCTATRTNVWQYVSLRLLSSMEFIGLRFVSLGFALDTEVRRHLFLLFGLCRSAQESRLAIDCRSLSGGGLGSLLDCCRHIHAEVREG